MASALRRVEAIFIETGLLSRKPLTLSLLEDP